MDENSVTWAKDKDIAEIQTTSLALVVGVSLFSVMFPAVEESQIYSNRQLQCWIFSCKMFQLYVELASGIWNTNEIIM